MNHVFGVPSKLQVERSLSLEESRQRMLTFPALAATAAGYDVYAAVDASGHFNRNAAVTGVLRLLQAGVIVTNSVPIVMKMLNDNADPKARDVYAALEMPHATLISQMMSSNEKRQLDDASPPSEKYSSQDVLAK
jgi:hypothetical protein